MSTYHEKKLWSMIRAAVALVLLAVSMPGTAWSASSETESKHTFRGEGAVLLPLASPGDYTARDGQGRFKAAAKATGAMNRPDVACTVTVYAPANKTAPGGILQGGTTWNPARTLTVAGNYAEYAASGQAMLSFSFKNNGGKAIYAQILNCTERGQVLPVLPPLGRAAMPRRIEPGGMFSPRELFLELTAPVEYARIFLSAVPLDIAPLAQKNFTSGPLAPTTGGGTASETDFYAITVKITRK